MNEARLLGLSADELSATAGYLTTEDGAATPQDLQAAVECQAAPLE